MNFGKTKLLFQKIYTKGLFWVFLRLKREVKTPSFKTTKYLMKAFKTAQRWICGLFYKDKRVNEDYVTALWDLNEDPMTFDFAFFLVAAELFAYKNGKNTFFVQFIRSSDAVEIGPPVDSILDTSDIRWRFENIVIPLINLCPACIGYSVSSHVTSLPELIKGKLVYPDLYDGKYAPRAEYYKEVFHTKENFVGLRAPIKGAKYIELWKKFNKIENNMVTITLRQYNYDPIRNSNIDEWVEFAGFIERQGFTPVFIPDTFSCYELDKRLDDFIVFRDPCWNVSLRMAMYEGSYLNFFVPNGPPTIAQLNRDVASIFMKYCVEGSLQSGADVHKNLGLEIGQRKYGFSREYQILSWQDDKFENICEEFNKFLVEHPAPVS
jgi:hypothetical protein